MRPIPKLTHLDRLRFSEKVDRRGDHQCWPWTEAVNQYGHGTFHIGKAKFKAHRIAYALSYEDPGPALVIHRCGNTRCCNPSHLFTGDAQDLGDMNAERGVMPDQTGEANPNAVLTAAQVAQIRERIACGETNISIAEDYPVTHSMVSKIRRGHSW